MTTSAMNGIRTYDPLTANKPVATASVGTSATDQTQNFLKLLVAQIQNQDPMSPMDASTMTSQMSNLSMVNSMQTMNTSLTSLLSQMQSANFITQSSSIGHSPLAVGNVIGYQGSGSVLMGANAVNALSNLTATISDATGNIVKTVNLGAAQAGMNNYSWDGKDSQGNQLPAGRYSISLVGTTAAGATDQSPTSYVASPVVSVSKGSDGTSINLLLADGRTVDANNVTQWDT
jgi:flagellar basal-body rod modification protein FlgD